MIGTVEEETSERGRKGGREELSKEVTKCGGWKKGKGLPKAAGIGGRLVWEGTRMKYNGGSG